MREIKFRVWGVYANGKPTRPSVEPRDIVRMMDHMFEIEDGIAAGLTFDQYTGVKDKNGAEIYESDIVRVVRSYGYGFLPKGAKAVVEFDEKELCYKLSGQGKYRLTANKEVEVIGNIHENKELWIPDSRNPKGGGEWLI